MPTANIKAAQADILLGTVRDWANGKFYQRPSSGIPKSDLSEGVQDSLDRADAAVQEEDLTQIRNSIAWIQERIPEQATAQNQLADKGFVNSSIATATATFKGTFDAHDDLGLTKPASHQDVMTALASHPFSPVPDKNDYVFVINWDNLNHPIYERYKFGDSAWSFEYALNNSSFNAAQWEAINSDITAHKVDIYDAHVAATNNPHNVTKAQVGLGNVDNTSDANKPVSTAQQTALDGKQDLIDEQHPLNALLIQQTEERLFVTREEKNTFLPAYKFPGTKLEDGYGDTKNPYASKTANYVLAAPNGSNGVPSFRALVTADISDMEFMTSAEMLAILNA